MFEDDYIQSVEADDPDMPLDSTDAEYLRGIDVGIMLQSAIMGFPLSIKTYISNAEIIMRLADAYELEFSAEDADEPDRIIVHLLPPEQGEYYEEDEY